MGTSVCTFCGGDVAPNGRCLRYGHEQKPMVLVLAGSWQQYRDWLKENRENYHSETRFFYPSDPTRLHSLNTGSMKHEIAGTFWSRPDAEEIMAILEMKGGGTE